MLNLVFMAVNTQGLVFLVGNILCLIISECDFSVSVRCFRLPCSRLVLVALELVCVFNLHHFWYGLKTHLKNKF